MAIHECSATAAVSRDRKTGAAHRAERGLVPDGRSFRVPVRGVLRAVVAGILSTVTTVALADIPASAQKLIADLKLGPQVTAGWAEEHVVPSAWIGGAEKEKQLRINGTWEPKIFRELIKPFSERYPFIKVNYFRGSNDTRVRAPLIAFRQGQFTTDVVFGIDSTLMDFRSVKALTDLNDLPNKKNVPEGQQTKMGDAASVLLRYWCVAYNPKLISKEQLPGTWEDLITTQQLHGGQLALWRGVSAWLLPLWSAKGPDWTKDYVHKLFTVVQPQKRREGAVALVNLVIAGEFRATLAAAEYQIKPGLSSGAPIAFHCPSPVPATAVAVGILNGSPSTNSAKLFLNWLLSKEGQLSQYVTEGSPPIHKGLQDMGFMPFPESIAGKPLAFRTPDLLESDIEEMFKVVNPYLTRQQ